MLLLMNAFECGADVYYGTTTGTLANVADMQLTMLDGDYRDGGTTILPTEDEDCPLLEVRHVWPPGGDPQIRFEPATEIA